MSDTPIPADHDHDIIGKDAYYLSRQMADLRSDIRSWQQETNARIDNNHRETNARIDSTNARIDSTNARIDNNHRETNARIDNNHRETNARIDAVNGRLTALLIAGLVAAAGVIGTLVAGFITVLQRL